jgi:predicted kinase
MSDVPEPDFAAGPYSLIGIPEVSGADPFVVLAALRAVLALANADDSRVATGWTAEITAFARDHAPIRVLGLDVRGFDARAHVRDRAECLLLITISVEQRRPHRVARFSSAAVIPPELPARLPMGFPPPDQLAGRGGMLVVFSGLPGTGKSTLADAAGRELGIPVLNADWLLGSLTPFGGYHIAGRQVIGAELVTTLAYRQLSLGQSAILDYPAEDLVLRRRWRSLAAYFDAYFKVIVCDCPDLNVHRDRLLGRRRGIPGFHEGGNWPAVEQRRRTFPAWEVDALQVDSTQSPEANVRGVLRFLRDP